jgi:acyl-[acyl-carrier-protein]-phospholipid O-acyltransferase/long-chain-fatty-acid--[acyl-carrier-protein] ligase
VFLAQFPTFAKDILGGNEQVSTLFLIVFSLGVGFGSTLCNRILKGKVSAKLVAPSCIGLSLSTFSLYLFSVLAYKGNSLIGVTDFLKDSMSWGIILSLFLLAAFGGMFSVPMYAIMQSKSPEEHQARVVACLNITDSFGMVLSAVFVTGLLVCGVSIIKIFLILGVTNLLITPLLSRMVGDKHD